MVADMMAKESITMEDMVSGLPIGRLGRPEEIAAAVLWLCSPGASFVIGHALDCRWRLHGTIKHES